MASSKALLDIINVNRKYWESHDQQNVAADDAHLRRIAHALDQMPVLERGGSLDSDPLQTLNLELDTLPYLFILSARIKIALSQNAAPSGVFKPGGVLWKQTVAGLTTSDPVQARYAVESWQTLIEGVLQSALHCSTAEYPPASSLKVAAAGILRIDPSGGTLSLSHANLVRACLQSDSYAPAKPVLDRQIHSLPFTSASGYEPTLNSKHYSSSHFMNIAKRLTTPVTLLDVLEYYLGGAMIYIALGEWTQATQFLEHVLSTPCSGQGTAHALMLEAYKKWSLTTLLAYGESRSPPKTASSGTIRSLSALSKEYESVAEAFKLADGRKLRAEVTEAMEEFRQAGNEGLVRNVVARHQQLVVSKLANTYTIAPFSMVAHHLGISEQETATYVQDLVKQGLVQATIEQQKGRPALRFGAAAALKTERELRAELVEQKERILELSAQVAEVDRRLGISKEFIEHTAKARKQKSASKDTAEQEEAMDVSFAGPVSEEEEESVMADVG